MHKCSKNDWQKHIILNQRHSAQLYTAPRGQILGEGAFSCPSLVLQKCRGEAWLMGGSQRDQS